MEGLAYLANVAIGNHSYITRIQHIKALAGIEFSVRPGERVGLIGRNGSGKTTLLNIISGALVPTSGSVSISGDLYHMESGTVSFDAELSARENIKLFLQKYLGGDSIDKKIREVEDFLELGEYFDQPVRTYSLGMRARSEFAAATSVEASLILIDEVLGAGDIYWSEKCADRIEAYCRSGKSLMLVSHSMGQVLRFCERVIWLDNGKVVMDGDANEVVRRYETYIEKLTWHSEDIEDKTYDTQHHELTTTDAFLEESGQRIIRWPGKGDIIFAGIWINDNNDNEVSIGSGEDMEIRLLVKAIRPGEYCLRFLVTLWDAHGKRAAIIENTGYRSSFAAGQVIDVKARVEGSVYLSGQYHMTFSIFSLADGGSSFLEQDIRQDAISKSIKLNYVGDMNHHSGIHRPFFMVPMQLLS